MVNSFRKFVAALALLSVELIVVLVLFVLSLLAFVFITGGIFHGKDTRFDERVFGLVMPMVNAFNTKIMVSVSFLASQDFLLPANILLIIYFLFINRHRWYSIRVPVVSLGSLIVMMSLKAFFHRPRPLDPVYEAARGFSYPSGHAMSAMTFYGLLIYLLWEKLDNTPLRWISGGSLALLILLIGFSRVYLRVHYASDVMAGFAIGLIWLVMSLWVMQKIEKYTRRNIAPVVNDPGA